MKKVKFLTISISVLVLVKLLFLIVHQMKLLNGFDASGLNHFIFNLLSFQKMDYTTYKYVSIFLILLLLWLIYNVVKFLIIVKLMNEDNLFNSDNILKFKNIAKGILIFILVLFFLDLFLFFLGDFKNIFSNSIKPYSIGYFIGYSSALVISKYLWYLIIICFIYLIIMIIESGVIIKRENELTI